MTNDEAKRHLEAARLMLLCPDGQPVSELYDALGVAIEALEAVPVHGEWIRTDDNICYAHICSVCRKHVRVCIGLRCHDCDTEANYCPNCGAVMDGKEVEHETN